MTISLDGALAIARQAAELAAVEIMRYYRGDFQVEIKPDQTPVTVADRKAEEIIHSTLLTAFPDHGFYGEEGGKRNENADYLWLVDPIDGTRSFVAGFGMFSTQIALMHRGELILGVSHAPAADETIWAVKGQPACKPGVTLRVSECDSVDEASISTGNIGSLARSPRWSNLGAIMARAMRTRGYGDYYHYHRLAAGQLDAVIESDVNILDIAALSVIVESAGGRFTDLEGRGIGLDTRSVLAAPPNLHKQLLEMLNGQ
jgi:histidinol-phosphatase